MSATWPAARLASSRLSRHRARPRAHLRGIPLAGVVSVLANLCCLNLALADGLSTQLAWALAFEIGTLVSFAAHQLVTWRGHLPASAGILLGRLLRFQAGALFALVLNLGVFALLIHARLPLPVADLAGIAAGFGLNTMLGLRFTFAR